MMTGQDRDRGTTPREPAVLEDRLRAHWAEWGLFAAVATLCAGLIPASLMPWWYPVLAGFFGGAVAAAFTYHFSVNARLALVIAAWSASAAGWLAVTRWTGVWHVWVLVGWAVPAVILDLMGMASVAHAREVEEAITADRAERRMIAEAGGEAKEMTRLLAEFGAPGARVFTVRESAGGKSYTGRLERVGDKKPSTRQNLEDCREPLAIHLQLGLADVYFEKPDGGSEADFTLHVQNGRSAQAGEVPYLPKENTPTSITRKIAVGIELASRKVYEVLFREIHTLISGATGSGKSNLVDVLVAQHSRCFDNVNFFIDLKGGATVRRWIRPWVTGMCKRPVIDWAATTLAEAYLLVKALVAAMEYRQSVMQGEKIIPARPTAADPGAMPQLTLFLDEAARTTGNDRSEEVTLEKEDGSTETVTVTSRKIAAEIADLCEMGRAAAISVVVCSVRADAGATGTTRIKAACKLRFGLSVTQHTEAQSVFPDHPKAAQILVGIVQRGAGLVLNLVKGVKISPPVWFYRLTDGTVDEETMEKTEDRITPIAADCGDNITCPVDDATADAMGWAYATRWTREHGQSLKARCGGTAVMERVSTGDAAFDEIVSQIPDPDLDIDPREKTLRRLLREAGAQGMTPKQSTDALLDLGEGAARETVQKWLSKMLAAQLVTKNAKVPTHPRYIWTVKTRE